MTAAVRVLEHNALVYRRTWRGTLFSTLLSPVLFLTAMGLGLGSLVDATRGGVEGVRYAEFLAPGLLTAQAMQTGVFESTYPILAAIMWIKTYDAMLATPVSAHDIVLGQVGWMGIRLAMVTGVFFVVMVLFGFVSSVSAILAWPVAILTGLAFSIPVMAFTSQQTKDTGFNVLFRFVVTPLFLFAGIFYPISQLPDAIEWVAYLTPIYHGVALARGLALGTATAFESAVHLAFLLGVIAVAYWAAERGFRKRLVK